MNFNKTNIAVAALLLVYLFSMLFSVNRSGSFWGWPQPVADSLISAVFFAVAYFLVINSFSKKDILVAITTFLVAAFAAQVIGILQMSGIYLPFSFAGTPSFNTIGSVGSIGFFSVIVLCLCLAMIITSRKWWKIFFGVQILASVAVLILVNYQVPGFTQRANEVFLSQQDSFKIAWQALAKNPVFGSGLGTFSYDFLMFKDPSFSSTMTWGVVFSQAASKILTDLATTGVLGVLALLAVAGFAIFYGAKTLLRDKANDLRIVLLGLVGAMIAIIISFFLYNANFVLNFAFFFVAACIVNIVADEQRRYELKNSPKAKLITAFAFAVIFTFGFGLWALGGQRYIAEIYYHNGLAALRTGDIDGGLANIEQATRLNAHSDLYFRQLSLLYLQKLSIGLQGVTNSISEEQKTEFQTLISNSVNAAKIATDINPSSAANLINRGYIFQNLIGLVSGAPTWALKEYDESLKIDPNNPYVLMQKGNISLILSQQAVKTQKVDFLAEAQSSLEKAVELRPNYYEALYSLGLVYDGQGQKAKAIEIFTALQKVNPDDTDIGQILKSLNSGLPASFQGTPPSSQTPPDGSQNTITE
ncbi:MAG TPA: tetratricopeptide repeat protein [Candidatus Staskawiczbacteria bacterium]|nr:tetratricopeptide repeat protein [Candidatus Staskawiczbacteria bacterium]